MKRTMDLPDALVVLIHEGLAGNREAALGMRRAYPELWRGACYYYWLHLTGNDERRPAGAGPALSGL